MGRGGGGRFKIRVGLGRKYRHREARIRARMRGGVEILVGLGVRDGRGGIGARPEEEEEEEQGVAFASQHGKGEEKYREGCGIQRLCSFLMGQSSAGEVLSVTSSVCRDVWAYFFFDCLALLFLFRITCC